MCGQKRGEHMSNKKGRPKLDNPKNERIYIRVTKEEKEEIMNFSDKSGYTILDLIKKGIEKVKGQKK
jgi:hypothetical protein